MAETVRARTERSTVEHDILVGARAVHESALSVSTAVQRLLHARHGGLLCAVHGGRHTHALDERYAVRSTALPTRPQSRVV
jgi:hypothetical protein